MTSTHNLTWHTLDAHASDQHYLRRWLRQHGDANVVLIERARHLLTTAMRDRLRRWRG